MMNMETRNEYLKELRDEYLQTKSKKGKSKLLDEARKRTKLNRKYLIRKLKPFSNLDKTKEDRKKRKRTYNKRVVAALVKIWKIMDYPCGQRLEPILSELVDILRKHNELDVSDEIAEELKKMSSATIDRRLEKTKSDLHRKRFSTTKPGCFLKNRIPVRLNDWNTSQVGNIALDLVAHCGSNNSGEYGNSISNTEIATGWWEGEAMLGKSQERTLRGIDLARKRSPFEWLGIHPDNDAPFLNAHILRYTEKEGLEFTRSRPNKKNDNCYVEQKNWTHVRKLVGYSRYDTEKEIRIINELYRNELRLYKNFFQPVMKLKEKTREGGRKHRKYR
jgi:hypothetical protein